jgi:hypothetical protein
MDGDGIKDRLGWVGRDDGILALDRNGNGRIDDFSEMSFVHDFLGAATDLEGLFAYDSNGDGLLTADDQRFAEFLIWRDSNGNGKSEKHELFTLNDLGIASIALERNTINSLRPNDEANQILGTSTFQTSDGDTGQVGDVALFVALRGPDCGCHTTAVSRTAVTEMLHIQFEGLIP